MLKDSFLHLPQIFMCKNFTTVDSFEHLEPSLIGSCNSLNNLKNFFASSFSFLVAMAWWPNISMASLKKLGVWKTISYQLRHLIIAFPTIFQKFFITLIFFPIRLWVRLSFTQPLLIMIPWGVTLYNPKCYEMISYSSFSYKGRIVTSNTWTFNYISLTYLLKAYLMKFSTPTS